MQKTIVLSSARAIRYEQLKIQDSTLFLPSYMTMSEFISKLCIVKDFSMVDNDTRVLLLLQASDFKSFANLQIQRNFFTFTKNSAYIFKFFEELSAEKYDISTLDASDIYAEYEEHISILQELYRRYEELCFKNKILDKIFLPKLYKFNESFVKRLKNINIKIDGHLTNFELELLQRCCENAQVNLIFNATKFNTKMQRKFLEIGLELEEDFSYKISLNQKNIIQKTKINTNKNITCESFSEPILQVAFVKQKIYEFIKKGYLAQNIAVILPDESMAEVLKTFDDEKNLNFAMGESFSKTKTYEKLNATSKAIDTKSKENFARLQRVGDEFYVDLLSIYHKKSNEVDFIEFLQNYLMQIADKTHKKIFEEEIYSFKNILAYMQNMSIKSLMSLFLQRLASRSIDDVRGGEITVMGVLETRSLCFDAVIIVDFSDANVPKRSDKDMFLNTKIREVASLPTMSDRENLQKHYYKMLIDSSKEVAISYVKSTQSSASRFLKYLNIKEQSIYSEMDYASIIFKPYIHEKLEDKEIILDYSFKGKKLSATRLKTFLTCKRKYYYSYIKGLNSHTIPKDMPQEWEIGSSVHDALKELYTKQNHYTDIAKLKKDLSYELDKVCGESELEKYLISMQKKRMDVFCQNEIKRFSDAWSVKACEESLDVDFAGMTLIGQIDRIDEKDGSVFVLDYKTGSYPVYNKNNFTDAKDFQLEFYYLLAQKFGEVLGCGYYDLKESKIVNEAFLQEKLAILESHIKDLLNIENVNFSKTEDLKSCMFCEYATICQR